MVGLTEANLEPLMIVDRIIVARHRSRGGNLPDACWSCLLNSGTIWTASTTWSRRRCSAGRVTTEAPRFPDGYAAYHLLGIRGTQHADVVEALPTMGGSRLAVVVIGPPRRLATCSRVRRGRR